MSSNESYDLAEKWVVEQIDDELRDERVPEGTEIDAGDLQECDCIPTGVKDCRGRRWVLVAVRSDRHGLGATYRC